MGGKGEGEGEEERIKQASLVFDVFSFLKDPTFCSETRVYTRAANSQQWQIQAWVVQTLDSVIHQINHYPVDKY